MSQLHIGFTHNFPGLASDVSCLFPLHLTQASSYPVRLVDFLPNDLLYCSGGLNNLCYEKSEQTRYVQSISRARLTPLFGLLFHQSLHGIQCQLLTVVGKELH
jgi:hypothetical protein